MIHRFKGLAIATGLAIAAFGAGQAHAAPMTFDCDTPTDHSSSLTIPVAGAVSLAGSVTPLAMRPGKGAALGGFLLNSADGQNSVGFQIVQSKPGAAALDLVLVARNQGKLERKGVRQLPINAPLSFSLVLDPAGQGRFTVGELGINLAFANLGAGKAMAFCSAGQFRFNNLEVASAAR